MDEFMKELGIVVLIIIATAFILYIVAPEPPEAHPDVENGNYVSDMEHVDGATFVPFNKEKAPILISKGHNGNYTRVKIHVYYVNNLGLQYEGHGLGGGGAVLQEAVKSQTKYYKIENDRRWVYIQKPENTSVTGVIVSEPQITSVGK